MARRAASRTFSLDAFRALRGADYRIWALGALVSNIGTWMQRTAQDWLVLTDLTAHSASAVGIVTALQFGPQLLFLPWIGAAADSFDRRKLLMLTQAGMGLAALLLGLATITHVVALWHVYVFAFLSGTVSAFDAPARQTFVSDLVGDADLPNAVALNSTSFNAARMIGPAVAGICIAHWGTGPAFLVNGASFFAVLGSLSLIRRRHARPNAARIRIRGGLMDGIRYIRSRSDLSSMLFMLLLVGAFGFNFPIFISTMSATVFHMGAGRYGLLTSTMAIGTTLGALLATLRKEARMITFVAACGFFGLWLMLAAIMPSFWTFAAMLLPLGISSLTITNVSNSLTQLATDPAMRGRVIAIRLAVMSGISFVGAPIVGWVADAAGPRWALVLGASSGLAAALIGLRELRRELRAGSEATTGSLPIDTAAEEDSISAA